jgi:hypothetical protein
MRASGNLVFRASSFPQEVHNNASKKSVRKKAEARKKQLTQNFITAPTLCMVKRLTR